MRFLLFNVAVVAALFYLFNTDRSGSDMGGDLREDPLEVIRQELATLARDIADGREAAGEAAPQTAGAESSKDRAQEPPASAVEPELAAPAPTAAESTGQDSAQAVAQASETDRGSALADPLAQLPQVDDPAVARRRAEVLDGAPPTADRRSGTSVETGPPMSPEERLRKLYSLAEEMELLYVNKITR